MRLFLDTEFNSFGGELMSIALVPEDLSCGNFYAVLNPPVDIHPWVKDNVVPRLELDLCWGVDAVRAMLAKYLRRFLSVHIMADWPEDIIHLCRLVLTDEPGKRIDTPPLTMEIVRVDSVSERPHHALYDAIAFREEVLRRERHGRVVMEALAKNPDILSKLHRRIASNDPPVDWV